MAFLLTPWVDKTIAVVASVPFVYLAYRRLSGGPLDIPRIALLLNFTLLIGTMLARRAPARVTTNLLFWVTAFVATYWGLLTLGVAQRGAPVAPRWLTDGIALGSLAVSLTARLTLGRNIGFVPALRRVVTHGIYGVIRHPIYTGIFISYLGFALRAYSPRNVLVAGIGCALFVIKTFMEEHFLAEDPGYAAYMRTVRWRWFPYLG